MKRHLKTSLFLWTLVCLFFPQVSNADAFVGGRCVATNGMYVSLGSGEDGVLGNFSKETELLEFSEKNGFNYLIFYDLEGMGSDVQRQDQLANLVSRAKTSYGIQQVGVALGAASSADEVVAYNNSHAANAQIDVLNLEYEFWHSANRSAAFQDALDILSYFETVSAGSGLETEIYIGWITQQEGSELAGAADRILIHYYRQDDTNLLNYGLDRLEYLASGNDSVKVAPIFSNEGPTNTGDPTAYFMGPWLENHSIDQPFKSWIQEYEQLNENWKSNIEVMGSTWFLYNYFSDIPVNGSDHVLTHPMNTSACDGDTVSLTLSSSTVDRDIGWSKEGHCLTDSDGMQGTGTETLTLSGLGSDDFGSYAARVVSYDSDNPTSQVTDTATISESTSCVNSEVNIAQGKSVSASSFIAAGYEPTLITDGDTAKSRWASEYTGDQWIQVDLGSTYNLNELTLYWDAAYAVDYQIMVSVDGSSWQTLVNVADNHQLTNNHNGSLTPARFVRVYGSEKALPQWGYSLYEFEIFGDPSSDTGCLMGVNSR